jgi:hypothetical protein
VFKFCIKEIFAKEKTGRVISYRDSRLSALCADRQLVNKSSAAPSPEWQQTERKAAQENENDDHPR